MINIFTPRKDYIESNLCKEIPGEVFPLTENSYILKSNKNKLFRLFPYILISLLSTLDFNISVNSQTLGFTEINFGQLSPYNSYNTSCQWIDYDNDGDLDIFYSYDGGYLGIFKNTGGNNFERNQFAQIVNNASRYVWGDYDKDDDLDLFVYNKIFINNGDGTFTFNTIPQLEKKSVYGLDLGDVDNDGDLDLACLMADDQSSGIFTRILFNNNGTFSKPYYEMPGAYTSNVKFVDYDKDNALDLVIHFGDSTLLYRNSNLNYIYEVNVPTRQGHSHSKINIIDYDNDFDPDILASGNAISNNYPIFNINQPVPGWPPNLIEMGDVDNDGDLDVIYLRDSNSGILYLNNSGTYTNSGLSFPVLNSAYADWGDYDNDGDLDLLVTCSINGYPYLMIYQNTLNTSNSAPSPPSILNSNVSGNVATISWNKGTDSEGPADGLMYNIYIKKGADIIKPGQADAATGFIRMNFEGNVQQDLSYKIKNLSAGTYSWSVQSIDQGAKGSLFAPVQNFTITYSNSTSPVAGQTLLPGANGTALSVTETGSFDTRTWAYALKPGGPYQSLNSTLTSYTPNFVNPGDYYLVCMSIKSTDTAVSNEVNISVSYFEEIELPGIGSLTVSTMEMVDFDDDDDYDLLTTAYTNSAATILYQNNSNVFTPAAGFSPTLLTKTSSSCFDYNNDGLIDILISGQNTPTEYSLILYKNKGGLVFEQVGTISEGIINGSIDHGDYNNDGLIDVILSGILVNNERVTKVLRNTGNGAFTDANAILAPMSNGTTKFIDLNNDKYLDIFLTGTDLSGNPSTLSYLNDGNGNFQPSGFIFKNFKESHADFGDYNKDGYVDILITGMDPYQMHTYVYKNLIGTQFQETLISYNNSSNNYCEWFDYDNDGDLDILMVSDNSKRDGSTVLSENLIIENKGDDSFIKNLAVPRQMKYKGSSALKIFKYDGDSDADFIQSAYDPISLTNKLIIYRNVTPAIKTAPSVPSGLDSRIVGNDVVLTWIDNYPGSIPGSTFNISIFSGTGYPVNPQANLANGFRKIAEYGDIRDTTWIIKNLVIGNYTWRIQAIDNSLNTSAFSTETGLVIENLFKPNLASTFENVSASGADWGDYDNDGDLDLVIAGSSSGGYVSKIYKNVNNVFQVVNIPLTGIYANPAISVEWIDINNDNNLDLALFGNTTSDYSTGRILKLYINMGGDVFSNIYTYSVTGGSLYTLGHGDFDNDGDIDFVISPNTIIRNNGNLTFTEIQDNSIYGSYLDIVDVDNDLDFDVAAIGGYFSNLKLNNGNGNFTNMNNALPFLNSYGEIKWFDYNNDTYIDFVMTGLANSYYITKIMKNNRDFTFSEVNTILKGSQQGNLSFGDYNNDGDFDFFINGKNTFAFTELYENDNYNNFVGIDYNFPNNGYSGKSKMGDFDKDGDLDIISTGYKDGTGDLTTLYENTKNWPNTKPSIPGNLRFERPGLGVILRWNAATDAESKDGGLSYNVRLGTTQGGCDIISPLSDLTTGFRKVAKIGNAQFNTGYKLNSLPIGTYYWSVQTIDHSFLGGEWAPEQSFNLTNINVNFNFNEVCLGIPTTFQDLSVANGVIISNWDWYFGDGTHSTLKNPSHIYSASGTYQVKLVASYLDGSIVTPGDSITKTIIVRAKPATDFNANIACQGTPTTITNSTNLNGLTITSWNWNFGDGQTSTTQNPTTHGYLNAGDFSVKLYAIASNGCSDSIRKTVSVGAIPVAVVTSNAPLTFCNGDSVTLSVGNNPNYSYKWKLGGTAITNGISNSYKIKQSGSYTLEVVNSVGNCSKTSDVVIVTAQAAPVSPIITTGGSTTFCQGDSVILSVANNPAYNYQWKLNGGATGSNLSTFAAKTSGTYSLQLSNSSGCSAISSNTIPVTSNPKPLIPSVNLSGSTSFCLGSNVVLSVTINPLFSYQWMNTGNNISGATTNSYIATNSGNYALKVTNAEGCIGLTQEIPVNVSPLPTSPSINAGGPLIFCQGDSVVLNVTNNPAYSYQWKLNAGAIGTNNSSYLAKLTGNYSLVVSNTSGCSVNSTNSIDVLVNAKPLVPIVSLSGSTNFCQGGSVVLSVIENPDYRYRWKNNDNNISGATSSNYTAVNSGIYKLNITNLEGCSSQTQEISVNVAQTPISPTINTIGSITFCQGDSVNLSVSNNSTYTYHWKLNGGDVGSNSNEYNAKAAGTYTLSVSNATGCSTSSTNSVIVTVKNLPALSSVGLSGATEFCEGENLTMSVSAVTGYTYRWDNANGAIAGATNNTYQVTESGIYRLAIINQDGCEVKSPPIPVLVKPKPAVPIITTENYIADHCLGENPIILKVDPVAGYTYQWKKNGVIVSGATQNHYEGFLVAGSYSVSVDNNGCKDEAIQPISLAAGPAKPTIIAQGSKVWYLACSDTTATQYNWYYNGQLINEANNYIYVANQKLGTYTVSISMGQGCFAGSDPVTIPLGTTGIVETDPFSNLKIYPNPTPGLFTIEMNNQVYGELNISIFTEVGGKILNIKFEKTTQFYSSQIDLSGQSDGTYLIKLLIDKYMASRKLIVH